MATHLTIGHSTTGMAIGHPERGTYIESAAIGGFMLKVGLLGEDAPMVGVRLDALNADHRIELVEQPEPGARSRCQLVIGAGPTDDTTVRAAADVWLDTPDGITELWTNRLVPFERNLVAGRRAPRRRRAVLFEPDPTWRSQAQRLIARLSAAVGDRAIRIDHIGSTSVAELPAKDLVDIQIVVADLDVAGQVADAAHAAGFVRVDGPLWCVDRHGTAYPEAVVVDADPGRPVNVNIRPVTAPIWREALLFRDWLRAEAAARAAYVALKRELAARPRRDVDDYGDDKIPWISGATGRAEDWAAETRWTP